MIQRHQRIVFWSLIACIVGMALLLAGERQHGREKVLGLADQTPIDAPATSTEPVTLDLANDADGSITAVQRDMALPSDANARARALVDHLIAQYAAQGSDHPLVSGSAVDEVYLVPLPLAGHAVDGHGGTIPVIEDDTLQPQTPGGELAVIDLRRSFVDQHPSGVEVESLTLQSIVGTLHANLPQIEQIRFLVDGQPRETLAGHADLLRTYASRDTVVAGGK